LKVHVIKSLILVLLFVSVAVGWLTAEAQKIPDCMLSYQFGPEQYSVIVEKSTQSLYIYSNYKIEPVETFKITTGKNHGRKLVEGDMKTPEGIYFARRIIAGDQLPKTDDYGEKAFTLNYPNPVDIKEERDGSGIWLHGAFDKEKINTPNSSRGCIVMKNQDLVNVSKYIFLNQTPICIYDKIKYDTIENIEKKRDRMINYLKEWKENWENKDINGYINFYEKSFTDSNMNLDQFKRYKNRLNKLYRFIKVILSDINIYGYHNYFVVSFNQLYISDRNHFYSKKIQYWTDYETKARITDEFSIRLNPPEKFEVSRGNYISVDEFRKDYLAQIKANTITVTPYQVLLKKVTRLDEVLKLTLSRSSEARGIKVIPVLRLEKGNETRFQSLPGISLKGGVPGDYVKAVLLENSNTMLVLETEKNFNLKSLTLFLINEQNNFDQIITYFFNQ